MSREHEHHQGAVMPDAAILLQRIDALTAAVASLAKIHGARLTRAEVCERLGIHRNTLRTYIDSRGFPAPGRDGKWLLAEVIEWEAGR
jgi:predicted DNA-binding transcriptional regulator AlpA